MTFIPMGANGQLFGLSATTWQLLDQIGILWANLAMMATLIGGPLAWLRRDRIRRWLRRNRFPEVGQAVAEGARWPAWVFTVSRAAVPRWLIEQQRPRAVALVATDQSWQTALELAALTRAQGAEVLGPQRLDDPDDPADVRDEVARLIGKLRRQGHERIAVDVTGGKTTMSLGAFMAAEEAACDTLYVSADYDEALKRPRMDTARLRCISCPPPE